MIEISKILKGLEKKVVNAEKTLLLLPDLDGTVEDIEKIKQSRLSDKCKSEALKAYCSTHGRKKSCKTFNGFVYACEICNDEWAKHNIDDQGSGHLPLAEVKRLNKLIKIAKGNPNKDQNNTFDDFKVYEDAYAKSQKNMIAVCKDFCNNWNEIPEVTGLIFIGKSGTGKNLIASAIVNELVNKHDINPLYTKAYKMSSTLNKTFGESERSEIEVMQDYIKPDLLIFDELEKLRKNSKGEISEQDKLHLFNIFSERVEQKGKKTIIISNLTWRAVKGNSVTKILGEELADRFELAWKIKFIWECYRKMPSQVTRDDSRG